MKQINKHQQDWDEPINENFAKFSNGQFSDNVIYLNGAKKYDQFPIWHCGYSVGEIGIFVMQGMITLPDLAAGQTIDIFNIPAITNKIHYFGPYIMNANEAISLNYDESVAGTFTASNKTANTIKGQLLQFKAFVICDN